MTSSFPSRKTQRPSSRPSFLVAPYSSIGSRFSLPNVRGKQAVVVSAAARHAWDAKRVRKCFLRPRWAQEVLAILECHRANSLPPPRGLVPKRHTPPPRQLSIPAALQIQPQISQPKQEIGFPNPRGHLSRNDALGLLRTHQQSEDAPVRLIRGWHAGQGIGAVPLEEFTVPSRSEAPFPCRKAPPQAHRAWSRSSEPPVLC